MTPPSSHRRSLGRFASLALLPGVLLLPVGCGPATASPDSKAASRPPVAPTPIPRRNVPILEPWGLPAPQPGEEQPIGVLYVAAPSVGLRWDSFSFTAVRTEAFEGEYLFLMEEKRPWLRVRGKNGLVAWIDTPTLWAEPACPKDRLAPVVLEQPWLTRDEGDVRATVVLSIDVDAKGASTATKLVSNTGPEAFAARAEADAKKLRFAPAVRRCNRTAGTYLFTREF